MSRKPNHAHAVLWLAALAVCLASCGRSTEPLTSAQLHARLLTSADAPAKMKIKTLPNDNTGLDSQPSPAKDPLTCDDLTSPALVLTGDPAAPFVGFASVNAVTAFWSGAEFLTSYHGDGAHTLIEDLKTLTRQCPTSHEPAKASPVDGSQIPASTITRALLGGPDLGDESLTLRATTRLDGIVDSTFADTIIIRSGQTLITVTENLGTAKPSTDLKDTDVAAIAAAAYAAFTRA